MTKYTDLKPIAEFLGLTASKRFKQLELLLEPRDVAYLNSRIKILTDLKNKLNYIEITTRHRTSTVTITKLNKKLKLFNFKQH